MGAPAPTYKDRDALSGPVRILDTSAILSGKPLFGRFVVPPAVDAEIEPGGRTGRQMQYLKEAGLEVRAPTDASLDEARRVAEETGDLGDLSEADLEVVALAIDLDAEVVTDDYRIQNVLESLGLSFTPVSQQGIGEEWEWTYRCASCGRTFDDNWTDCPVCGGEVQTRRSG